MPENEDFSLPSYLEQRDPSKEVFIDVIRNKLTEEKAKELAVRAALGEIRLPHVIPPQLTETTIKRFWTFSDATKLRSLYILMCSSLYYEVLAGKINPRKGKEIAGKIYGLFSSVESFVGNIMRDDNLFTRNFNSELEQYSSSQSATIPEQLRDILNAPLRVREEFNSFFATLTNKG